LPPLAIDENAVAQRLAQAVRLKTVSSASDAQLNADQFEALHALRSGSVGARQAQARSRGRPEPALHLAGSDPQAKPILLMAHQDVVPIAPGTEGDWQQPPFSAPSPTATSGAAARGTTRATCCRSWRPSSC
jgi:carboxypeptidase PM20D1